MIPVADNEIYINEAAELVGRKPGTLRSWEYNDMLPKHLLPARNNRGWRFWTPEQIEGIKRWLIDEDIRPGKGLVHYRPDAARVERHIARQRGPRPDKAAA
jgi:hypothetical protein